MAVWSSLRNIGKLNTLVRAISSRKVLNYVPIRATHGRTLLIRSSSFQTLKIKDLIFFYVTLGSLPLIALVTYVNIFIGPAELALIPDGYEPKQWEYYRHPITRFIVKYLLPSRQEQYERNLHFIFINHELYEMISLRNKVKEKMREKLDYQSWYYEVPPVKYGRKYKEDREYMKNMKTLEKDMFSWWCILACWCD